MADTRDAGSYDFAPEEDRPAQEPSDEPQPEKIADAPPTARKPMEAIPDRICPHCGFSIFGKTRGGRCPQCAAPLENTAQDLLQFSDPAWLRTMATGFVMIAAAVSGHVLAAVLRWTSPHLIGLLVHVAAATLLLLGILTATRIESGIGGKVLVGTAAARWSALAAIAVWVVLLLLALGLTHKSGATKWLTFLALACDGGVAIAFGLYARALAQRIPNDALANQSLNVSWLVTLVCFALMIIQAFELTTSVHLMFFFCSFPMIAGFVAILLWGIVVVLRLALDIRASATAGEAIAARRAQWTQNK